MSLEERLFIAFMTLSFLSAFNGVLNQTENLPSEIPISFATSQFFNRAVAIAFRISELAFIISPFVLFIFLNNKLFNVLLFEQQLNFNICSLLLQHLLLLFKLSNDKIHKEV